MAKSQKDIDKLVSEILNEEIESKVKKAAQKLNENEWKEKDLNEWFYFFDDEEENNSTPGDYEGDEAAEDEAEEKSAQEPTYVGRGLGGNSWDISKKPKMIASFDDEHGWYDDTDRRVKPDMFSDYDEEEFDDFEPFYEKHGKNQMWFAPGKEGKKFFDMYKEKLQKPFKVRTLRGGELGEELHGGQKKLDVAKPKGKLTKADFDKLRSRKKRHTDEAETEEGNAFTGALARAKKEGDETFKVGDKTFNVKEEKKEKKWIQKSGIKKGALHKKLGVPEDEKIPTSKLKSLKSELSKKAKGDKKLSAADSKLMKQVNLAMTLKGLKENKNILALTETELIDLIEKIVLEQKVKDKAEKSNITKKSPEGLKKTVKVQDESKKENDNYAKEVVEKMKKYIKDGGSKADFNENPESFPESNYTHNKMKEKTMKYHPSQAVDEYIEAFAYPGQTNLVFDEIKPDEEKIEMYLKGDSKTGNATKDKDGKALGNVVPSEVGERFMKNFEDNLYGAEQMNGSYKRQPQPVDVGGTEKMEGSLKSIRKGSTTKAGKIMNQLESTNNKKEKIISEEMNKMKKLISYDRKTQ